MITWTNGDGVPHRVALDDGSCKMGKAISQRRDCQPRVHEGRHLPLPLLRPPEHEGHDRHLVTSRRPPATDLRAAVFRRSMEHDAALAASLAGDLEAGFSGACRRSPGPPLHDRPAAARGSRMPRRSLRTRSSGRSGQCAATRAIEWPRSASDPGSRRSRSISRETAGGGSRIAGPRRHSSRWSTPGSIPPTTAGVPPSGPRIGARRSKSSPWRSSHCRRRSAPLGASARRRTERRRDGRGARPARGHHQGPGPSRPRRAPHRPRRRPPPARSPTPNQPGRRACIDPGGHPMTTAPTTASLDLEARSAAWPRRRHLRSGSARSSRRAWPIGTPRSSRRSARRSSPGTAAVSRGWGWRRRRRFEAALRRCFGRPIAPGTAVPERLSRAIQRRLDGDRRVRIPLAIRNDGSRHAT